MGTPSGTRLSGDRGAQASALVITHIFICERLARLEALGPKPRRGWPVYSNARARKTANPGGVTCARCKMFAPEKHFLKPLDSTWVRSPLRGLASVVSARGTINRPPPPGFGDSAASGLAVTRPARAISNPQALSQQLWVMARALSPQQTPYACGTLTTRLEIKKTAVNQPLARLFG